MKAHCWFCDSEQECDNCESSIPLAYGHPFPILKVSVTARMSMDGEAMHFVCEKCRRRILQAIADSRVISIKNVMAGAAG